VLRVTNNGITAAIDPAGRITQQLPPFQRLTSRLEFNFRDGITFYAAHGDWFPWTCLILGIAAVVASIFTEYRA
jgi:apolipoprotein N-acyltransferase